MAIQVEGDPLFNQGSLRDVLDARKQRAQEAVSKIDPNELLSRPSDKTTSEIVEACQIPIICLDRSKITAPQVEETLVDVRGDFLRFAPSDRPTYVPAARISLRVPYSGGSAALFQMTPSSYSFNPPCGHLHENSVVVSCLVPNDVLLSEQDKAITGLHHTINSIEEHVSWINEDLDKWKTDLKMAIETAIDVRQESLLEMRKVENKLGVPVERDSEAARTYTIPIPERRRPIQPKPKRTYESFEPEPGISETDFANIVTDIDGILTMFERLPITHTEAKEERLRDQILVSLHAVYGAGSAETFSKRGKTDIYLPCKNNAVFIAECKWWTGKKAFTEKALPQLLDRYIVWRDTHTAMILFIKNKGVSSVIQQAVESIQQHPRYVTDASPIGEVRTFILHKDNDEDRRLKLALLTASIHID